MAWDVQHYNTRISSGEDSILKLINGLIRPDTGVIRVRGRVGRAESLRKPTA